MEQNQIVGLIMTVFVVGLIASSFLTANAQIQATQTANTAAYNATGKVTTALGSVVDWLPVLVPIVMVVVLIGYFAFFRTAG